MESSNTRDTLGQFSLWEATSFPHGSASPSADISTDPIFDGLRKGGSLLCICFVVLQYEVGKGFQHELAMVKLLRKGTAN